MIIAIAIVGALAIAAILAGLILISADSPTTDCYAYSFFLAGFPLTVILFVFALCK